ncbi:protein takeout-like [Bacillus rossius redtenbacheri]|uniref:protein takeout-like n=1 Tax=Bacillus rossius redtenbacheri TaxID=93214 RepID=UPI002FDE6EE2
MKCAVYVAVLAALVGGSLQAALKLPSYLKPCSRSDPKLNDCALKNGIAAVPSLLKGDAKYHIPVLDPFHLKHIDIAQGTGPVKISLALDDVDIKGLKNVEVKAVNFDVKKKEIGVDLVVKGQGLTVDSKYKIDGQVLILPITGNGNVNLKIENPEGSFKVSYDLVKKEDGKEYIKLRDSTIDFSLSKAIFDFKNLFNGDKALGDNMNVFLNENWREVFTEVKPVLSEAMRTVILQILDQVVTTVPYDQLLVA